MAITGVSERRSHRYTFKYEDGQPLPSQDLTRSFWVYSDSVDENPDTVRTASFGGTSIPAYGAAHPTITAAIAQDFDVERDEEYTKRWTVNVGYASRRVKGGNGSGSSNQDPSLATKIVVSTVSGEKVVAWQIDDKPIALPSGEPIVVTVPWNELQLDFTQYRSVLDTAAYVQLATYRNAINSVTWRGFAPRTAKIVSMRGQEVDINGTTYLERNISVQLRNPSDNQEPDWLVGVVNAGFFRKETRVGIPGGDPAATYDVMMPLIDPSTGTMYTKAVNMNAAGTQPLKKSDPINFVEFKVYPELPFAALNI